MTDESAEKSATPRQGDSSALRAADRAANLAPTAELLREHPLAHETRRAIEGFKFRRAVRKAPVVGRVVGTVRGWQRGGRR